MYTYIIYVCMFVHKIGISIMIYACISEFEAFHVLKRFLLFPFSFGE